MKRQLLQLLLLFSCVFTVFIAQGQYLLPPNQPEQDACNALTLCGNSFFTPYSYQGIGQVPDLSETPCDGDEVNSVWFKLKIMTSGTIVFSIIPVDTSDDYDFAVLNVSNTNCNSLSSDNVVRCNFNNDFPGSNAAGIVGLNLTSTLLYVEGGFYGESFCQYIDAVAGETYLIMLNNFGDYSTGGPSQGFTIDFTGSTATFYQTTPPALESIDPLTCSGTDSSITVHLTEPALCGSIAADGSDFFTIPSVPISSATGMNCDSGKGYTSEIIINFAAPLNGGNYTLYAKQGTDSNTLIGLCNDQLQLPDRISFTAPKAKETVVNTSICYDELPYRWNGILVIHGGDSAAIDTAVSSNGCDSVVILNLAVSDVPIMINIEKVICEDQSYQLPWDSTVNSAGVFVYTYQNIAGCDSLLYNVTVSIDKPADNYTSLPLCVDSSIILNAREGFNSYVWNNGSTGASILINQPGIFTVQETDPLGCMAKDSFTVTGDSIAAAPTLDVSFCVNASVDISTNEGFESYLWNNGSALQTITVSDPGTYWVTVTDKANCKAIDSVIVIAIPLPANFLPVGLVKCFYSRVTVEPNSSFDKYLWSTGATTPAINIMTPGSYALQVTDANGCTGQDSININDSACKEYFYIPTAFTPNGDGKNDVFKPAFAGLVTTYSFSVYNRLGQEIFSSSNVANGWDGNFNSQPQASGTYVWVCSYSLYEQTAMTQKGTVVLIR